jgi:hypothetical protein
MDAGRDPAPPNTVTFRRFPDGFEIALLPPPRLRTSGKQLVASVLAGLVLVLIALAVVTAFRVLGQEDEGCLLGFSICVPLGAVGMALLMVGSQFDWNRETAVLEARDGLLTLVRSGGAAPKQWSMADVSTVRSSPLNSEPVKWGLQLILKNRQTFSTLEGRRRAELDWVAGLLRAALAPPRRPAPVAESPVVFLAGGECQVCGWAMEERVVLCAKCRTPHHEECWTYNGSCSTYGCREIRYTRGA